MVELALLLPFFTLVLVGVIDVGRWYYYSIEVANAAHAAALYGYQNAVTESDTTGMQKAAQDEAPDAWTAASSPPTVTVSPSGANGTECACENASTGATGLPGSISCTAAGSGNPCAAGQLLVGWVQVTVTASFTPFIPWPGMPNPITLKGTAEFRTSQ